MSERYAPTLAHVGFCRTSGRHLRGVGQNSTHVVSVDPDEVLVSWAGTAVGTLAGDALGDGVIGLDVDVDLGGGDGIVASEVPDGPGDDELGHLELHLDAGQGDRLGGRTTGRRCGCPGDVRDAEPGSGLSVLYGSLMTARSFGR